MNFINNITVKELVQLVIKFAIILAILNICMVMLEIALPVVIIAAVGLLIYTIYTKKINPKNTSSENFTGENNSGTQRVNLTK